MTQESKSSHVTRPTAVPSIPTFGTVIFNQDIQKLRSDMREYEQAAEDITNKTKIAERPVYQKYSDLLGFGPEFSVAQLYGHLLTLAADLLFHHDDHPRTAQCGADLALSANGILLLPSTASFTQNMTGLIQKIYPGMLGYEVQPNDLRDYGGWLMHRAELLHVPLLPELQPGGLYFTPANAEALAVNERAVETFAPTWSTRTDYSGLSTHEQGVMVALEYLKGRHEYANMPVLSLLDLAARNLEIATDIRRTLKADLTPCRTLKTELLTVRETLGNPRVPSLSRPPIIRQIEREFEWTRLHRLLYEFKCGGSQYDISITNLIWTTFSEMENMATYCREHDELATLQDVNIIQTLQVFRALAITWRAPGMKLDPVVEIAADLSDIDPMWAWDFFHTQPVQRHTLAETLQLLYVVIYNKIFDQSSEDQTLYERLMQQLSSDLFAQLRETGLKFPAEQTLKAYFFPNTNTWHYRASRLTNQERSDISNLLYRVTTTPLSESLQQLDQALETAQTTEALPVNETLIPAPIPFQPTVQAPHIQEVAQLLAGRSVTLLGGEVRPYQHQALEEAFGVKIDWIASDEYAHGEHAASRIHKDTALVILAVRWMAHAHNGLRSVARNKGVPFIMLPGGLSPSAVAHHILQQASEKLQAS